jgi:hypothetical protein
MTVNFNRDTALTLIANEKLGFRWGLPVRPDEHSLAAVLPLLRTSALKRTYLTLAESKAVHIEDTGHINRMRFTNKSDSLVFVRAGTLLKGGTQERATVTSAVLQAGTTVELEVRCVHASRAINSLSKVHYGGTMPLSMEQRVYRSGFTNSSQHEYWNSVSASNQDRDTLRSFYGKHPSSGGSRFNRTSSFVHDAAFGNEALIGAREPINHSYAALDDDLASNVEQFSKDFENILSKVKRVPGQVGMALITDRGCETIELFDLAKSWTAFHADAVKRVGEQTVTSDKEQVFEYRQDRAVKSVKDILTIGYEKRLIYEHKPKNGEPSVAVLGLKAEHYTGEIVEVDGRAIHVLLLRMRN